MAIAAYFMYRELGVASFVSLIPYILLLFINKYKMKLLKQTWKVFDKKRDKRMTMTSEAFNNAKMLKLYGWEIKIAE